MAKPTNKVLSCIQPTGEMHIGNYFGAVANWVKLQDQYDCIYGIVDYHAMTMPYDPKELRSNSEQLIVDLMACGLDPNKSIMFIQSLVPEHAELCWIFNCVTSIGDLNRMTQFKDKSNQVETGSGTNFVSGGLFTYPVLQAADILIYRADKVPIGKDQEQHLELSREIVRNFNRQFGDYFPEPKPLFTPSLKIKSTADPTKKMSKSLGGKHCITIFEEEKSIRKKIKSAVTDTGEPSEEMSPGLANLFELLKACGKDDEATSLRNDYDSGQRHYGNLKSAVADALVELTGHLRDERNRLMSDMPLIWKQIRNGSEQAREIARETIRDVRELVGLPKR